MTELRTGRSPLPPVDYIGETRRQYDGLGYDAYRWADRREVAPAWTPIRKPLSESKVMMIASGGIYETGQIAFHTRDDTSIRLIRSDVETANLRTAHFAYDQTDARTDPNCVFPIDVLRSMVVDGEIGSQSDDHVAFMGGIYSVRRLESETIPRILEHCRAQEPDLVLFIPV